jgi:hypothetical protein
MFSDRELRQNLATVPEAAALHQMISAWQPYVADQRRAAV